MAGAAEAVERARPRRWSGRTSSTGAAGTGRRWRRRGDLRSASRSTATAPRATSSFKTSARQRKSVHPSFELDREHAGALMLRAQTLVTLKDYQSALFDVNRLIEINPVSQVYRKLHARLKTQLSLAPIPECEEESLCLEEEELPSKQDQKIENSITKPDQPEPAPGFKSKPSNEQILERKPAAVPQKVEAPAVLPSKPQGWETIPKPKGHSGLDYSKWDKVEDDSSDDDEDNDEEELPQYKFKVRTVGVRSVK